MDREEAQERLWEILDELQELGEEARELIAEHFHGELARAEAYGVFDLGSSKNEYDTTLQSLVEELDGEEQEQGIRMEELGQR